MRKGGLSLIEAVQTEKYAFRNNSSSTSLARVPFGINHLDLAFAAGVKPASPQLNVIQGGGGARKTTLALNLIINQCISGKLPADHHIVIDTLENGMTIERFAIVIRSIVATKLMIYHQWTGTKHMPDGMNPVEYARKLFDLDIPNQSPQDLIGEVKDKLNGSDVLTCVLTPDFIEEVHNDRVRMTVEQEYCWWLAGEIIKDFPITIFGISEHNTYEIAEARSVMTTSIEESFRRWCEIAENYSSVQIVSDYLQEYDTGTTDHYDKQKVIVPFYSRWIKTYRGTIWAISQEGIGHQKDYARTGYVLGSSGGDVLKNASQTNWRVSYDKHISPFWMKLHSPVKSRRGNHPDILLKLEPNSGCIFGQSAIREAN